MVRPDAPKGQEYIWRIWKEGLQKPKEISCEIVQGIRSLLR
jgi:hypothetical protein